MGPSGLFCEKDGAPLQSQSNPSGVDGPVEGQVPKSARHGAWGVACMNREHMRVDRGADCHDTAGTAGQTVQAADIGAKEKRPPLNSAAPLPQKGTAGTNAHDVAGIGEAPAVDSDDDVVSTRQPPE